jgi:hypothetical protein
MIRYTLICGKRHSFEAWFKSSGEFDVQAKRKLIACPRCGSDKVEKALMAPSVKRTDNKRRAKVAAPVEAAVEAGPPQVQIAQPDPVTERVASMPPELREMLRRVRKEVEAKADYVGPRFAEEARKIHYDEAPARGIYGEASSDEVAALNEEGIEFYPLPRLPDDRN